MVAVTDGSGAVLGVNSYDPYGKPASGNIGRFGYTGQAWLPELGMWYYKARIYNPANNVARFMQSDPIGYGGGMNLYAYVSGDPVNGTDPTGLDCATVDPLCSEEIVVTARRERAQNTTGGGGGGGGGAGGGAGTGFGGGLGGGGPVKPLPCNGIPCKNLPPEPESKPEPEPKPDDGCAYKASSGKCIYRRDSKGKLQYDPDYAKEACKNFGRMMQSNKEIAALAGTTNLPGLTNASTGGSNRMLARLANFLSQPGFVFIRGVTYLTTGAISFGATSPQGCK